MSIIVSGGAASAAIAGGAATGSGAVASAVSGAASASADRFGLGAGVSMENGKVDVAVAAGPAALVIVGIIVIAAASELMQEDLVNSSPNRELLGVDYDYII